jgi:hypothetical protein
MSGFADLEFTEVEVPTILAALVRRDSGSAPAAIASALGPAFGAVMGFLARHGLEMSAPPRVIYESSDAQKTQFLVVAPIAAPPAAQIPAGPVFIGSIPGRKALRFTHRGAYRNLMETYGRITELMQEKGLMQCETDWARYMPMWEEYANDPDTTPEAELLTYIYLPVD